MEAGPDGYGYGYGYGHADKVMGKKTDAAERQRTKTSGNAGEQTDKTNKPSIKVYIAVYDSLLRRTRPRTSPSP